MLVAFYRLLLCGVVCVCVCVRVCVRVVRVLFVVVVVFSVKSGYKY